MRVRVCLCGSSDGADEHVCDVKWQEPSSGWYLTRRWLNPLCDWLISSKDTKTNKSFICIPVNTFTTCPTANLCTANWGNSEEQCLLPIQLCLLRAREREAVKFKEWRLRWSKLSRRNPTSSRRRVTMFSFKQISLEKGFAAASSMQNSWAFKRPRWPLLSIFVCQTRNRATTEHNLDYLAWLCCRWIR